MFADLFKPGGRPSVPAEVIASVIVLQTLHGLSDSETVEALTFDLRWKAACGLRGHRGGVPPDDVDGTGGAGCDAPSARTGSSTRSGRWSPQTGVLAGKTRRALDSTVLR